MNHIVKNIILLLVTFDNLLLIVKIIINISHSILSDSVKVKKKKQSMPINFELLFLALTLKILYLI